jgi:hypothetical protein
MLYAAARAFLPIPGTMVRFLCAFLNKNNVVEWAEHLNKGRMRVLGALWIIHCASDGNQPRQRRKS